MKTHSDVLIIGGGIIGLACAYYLNKAGRQVRIIEQDKVGSGASHGNCGLIYISHLAPLCSPGTIQHEIKRLFKRTSPLYVKPGFAKGRLRWLLRFALKCTAGHFEHAVRAKRQMLDYSQMLYDRLYSEENLDGDLEKKGVLLVYKSKSEWQDYEKTNAYLKAYGLDAKPYVGEALFDLEPTLCRDAYAGWYHTVDSHIRPDKFVDEWKQLLIRNGVAFEEDCPFEGFGFNQGRVVSAETGGGAYTAKYYILATGAWTPRISGQFNLNIPILPGKGYSVTMARPQNCPSIPCYMHEAGVVATPWKSGYRLGGTMEFSGFNTTIYEHRIQNLKNAARQYLQASSDLPVLEEWVGLRPMTYDDLPIIDWIPGHHNIVLAAGHGMMGVSLAPATGKVVADMIDASDPLIDLSPYSIRRFN